MGFSIQQLSDERKFSHALRFEVLEQLCPPELVSELLSRCHAWGERERSLNQLLVVYSIIALSRYSSAQSGGGLAPPGEWVTLALVEPVSASADHSGVGVSPEATGDACAAPPLPARLPTDGHGANQRGLSLRVAAHGHRWHLG